MAWVKYSDQLVITTNTDSSETECSLWTKFSNSGDAKPNVNATKVMTNRDPKYTKAHFIRVDQYLWTLPIR